GRGLNVSPHHPDFMVLLVQVMQKDVPQRHDSYQLLSIADRQMAESVTSHQQHAGLWSLIRTNRQRILSHDLGKVSPSRVAALGNHPPHEVALGKDPNQ